VRQIEIPLFVKHDKNDDEYMIGSLDEGDLSMSIDLKKVTFIIFDPVEDSDGNFVNPGKLIIRPKTDEAQRKAADLPG